MAAGETIGKSPTVTTDSIVIRKLPEVDFSSRDQQPWSRLPIWVSFDSAAGLLRRIQPSGSVARYESRVGDNHHHVVCRSCGVIADVDCAVGEAPCLTPSDHEGALDGFVLDEAEVIYWGLCPTCAGAPTN